MNFAVFARQLGVQAAFLGAFGDDPEGEHVAESARQEGVDISRCRRYHGENGCARVRLENGDRVFQGSNRCGVLRTEGLRLEPEDYEYLLGFDLIHSGIFGFAEDEVRTLKERGARISFDFSSSFTGEYLKRVLPYVDYPVFSCSHLEMGEMERLLEYAAGQGCALTLLSLIHISRGALEMQRRRILYPSGLPPAVGGPLPEGTGGRKTRGGDSRYQRDGRHGKCQRRFE